MTDPAIPYYVHDLSPVLLHIAGPFAIRWYGLAYLGGFLSAWWLLKLLARKKLFALPENEVGNFIMAVGIWGVLVGGRLGYALFYKFRETLDDPLSIVRLWDGGMSSHGGALGVVLVVIWYARKHRAPLWNLADNIAVVTPIGLFFGRMANFINGELWGRVTDVKWAVIFPLEVGIEAGTKTAPSVIAAMVTAGQLSPRHPSQLYEAVGEGLVLLAVLIALRFSRWGVRSGVLCGTFWALYPTARIICEFFREPDAALYFGWMTTGQFLSLFMYAASVCFFVLGRRAPQATAGTPGS